MESPSNLSLISQGAESKIYLSSFLGKEAIVKERVRKSYRVAVLDSKINKQRLIQEARCIARCRKAGVRCPSVFHVDEGNALLHLEKIQGRTLKSILHDVYQLEGPKYSESCLNFANKAGVMIARMHDADVTHGDLTTSNMIVNELQEVVLIDFGLGSMQSIVEDKAVDLYVLERAFLSTHPDSEILVAEALRAYEYTSKKSMSVLDRLEQVRLRGRKRDMIG